MSNLETSKALDVVEDNLVKSPTMAIGLIHTIVSTLRPAEDTKLIHRAHILEGIALIYTLPPRSML